MRRLPPFLRGMLIIAAVALVVVVLNLYTALATAAILLRIAFVLAMTLAAYLFWRDFARREIDLWPRRQQLVVYGAAALLVVDLIWLFVTAPSGRDALAFILVAAACVYAAVVTWRRQRTYGA